MSDVIYRTVGLTKRYSGAQKDANFDVNLEIRRGDIFGLFGANGAGKTTLIKQLMNLIRPTSGCVYLDGRAVVGAPDWIASRVSYLPQQRFGFHALTARQALFHTGRLRGLNRKAAAAQASGLIEEWRLSAVADRMIGRLSGGQQRLVGLTMALIGDLPVLLLDEPANELDPLLRRELWRKLRDLSNTQGKTIVLVTHNLPEAEAVVNRVGIMLGGRLIALGAPADLKRSLDGRVHVTIAVKSGAHAGSDFALAAAGLTQISSATYQMATAPEQLDVAIGRALRVVPMAEIEEIHVRSRTLDEIFAELNGTVDRGEPCKANYQ
jgi:ABC-2 type transport system ATP-binding protein